MKIKINPSRLFQGLTYILAVLLAINVMGIIIRLFTNNYLLEGLTFLFDFDYERNVPTFYSSLILMISAGLLFFIAIQTKKMGVNYSYWLGLALVFSFLTIDEFASIHEELIPPIREWLDTGGVFHFAWVIPYGVALLILAFIYIRFLFSLPKKTKRRMILAGCVYVMGAVGIEMLGAWQADVNGRDNLLYAFLYTVEESFEILGISIFIYSLLTFLCETFEHVSISVVTKSHQAQR